MLISRAFPRKGRGRGPGGSGRLVVFLFDQMDSKTTRDPAPMAITTVLFMTKDGTPFKYSLFKHALYCSKVWRDGKFCQPNLNYEVGSFYICRLKLDWYHPSSYPNWLVLAQSTAQRTTWIDSDIIWKVSGGKLSYILNIVSTYIMITVQSFDSLRKSTSATLVQDPMGECRRKYSCWLCRLRFSNCKRLVQSKSVWNLLFDFWFRPRTCFVTVVLRPLWTTNRILSLASSHRYAVEKWLLGVLLLIGWYVGMPEKCVIVSPCNCDLPNF